MRSTRLSASLAAAVAVATATGLAVSVGAGSSDAARPTTRVYVVVVRNSGLLTLCVRDRVPVLAPFVASSATGTGVNGAVFDREEHLALGGRPPTTVVLPVPRAGANPQGVSLDREELDRRVMVPDPAVKGRLEQEFRKLRDYTVVDGAEAADVVFVAETFYVPMTFAEGLSGPGVAVGADLLDVLKSIARMGLNDLDRGYGLNPLIIQSDDWTPYFLEATLAIAVPSSVYRTSPGDAAALLRAHLWDGMALEQPADDLAAAVRAIQKNARPNLAPRPAQPEWLVQQFARRKGIAEAVWVCPASTDPLDARVWTATEIVGGTDGPAGTAPGAGPERPAAGAPDAFAVTVPLIAGDANGDRLSDFSVRDVRLYEDDLEQPIDRLVGPGEPMDVALLVDTSRSTDGNLRPVEEAALTFMASLPEEARVLPVSFADEVFVQAEFTSDRSRLRRALVQMSAGVGTRLYDALNLVSVDRLAAGSARKAIVLLTDGLDTRSRLADGPGAVAAIDRLGLPVYAIQYGRATRPLAPAFGASWGERNDDHVPLPRTPPVPLMVLLLPEDARDSEAFFARATAYLRDLSEWSGGRFVRTDTPAGLADALSEISRDLHLQYGVRYRPSNQARDGRLRRIRIDVRRPHVQVRARSRYIAPSTHDR